ncbi:hypothetical protein BREVUG8_10400 [Brevundimonas sp. G8]|nr:hypothetical protein BREVUG8_10400 [Brevundimonas sp. G8]
MFALAVGLQCASSELSQHLRAALILPRFGGHPC